MKYLFAPWRSSYAHSKDDSKNHDTPEDACIFCKCLEDQSKKTKKKYFILGFYQHSIVLLNKFPYNAGHLLIVPHAHKASLKDLTKDARQELIELTSKACFILKEALKADGVNVGLNLGIAAGAGVPSHLHMHILPRWNRDTGFMPTIANTKVISFDLLETYNTLQPYFNTADLTEK